jgi:hypothetical protein
MFLFTYVWISVMHTFNIFDGLSHGICNGIYDYTNVQYMVFDCEVLWSIFKLSGYKSFLDKILFLSNSILDPNELVGRNFEWGTHWARKSC